MTMTAARRNVSLNLMKNDPVVYFFNPCENDQTNHGLGNEHKTEGVLA